MTNQHSRTAIDAVELTDQELDAVSAGGQDRTDLLIWNNGDGSDFARAPKRKLGLDGNDQIALNELRG